MTRKRTRIGSRLKSKYCVSYNPILLYDFVLLLHNSEEIRKNREKELLAKQELQRQKEQEEEKRKEESKKKIKEWMERKKQDSTKKATNPKAAKERQHSQSSSSEHLYCDPDAKFKSWLLNVRKREEGKLNDYLHPLSTPPPKHFLISAQRKGYGRRR